MLTIVAVSFLAIGNPSFLRIKGNCTEFNVVSQTKACASKEPCNEVVGEVNLNSCDTGIGLRNTHMKEKYLQTKSYPKAVFKGKLPMEGKFTGTLTVHGKAIPVSGEVKNKVAEFSTRISKHGIDVPSYLGVTVADEVKISVELAQQ